MIACVPIQYNKKIQKKTAVYDYLLIVNSRANILDSVQLIASFPVLSRRKQSFCTNQRICFCAKWV